MVDYYFKLVTIARKYVGYAAPRFIRAVLQKLRISGADLNASHMQRITNEIPMAVGKALPMEQKKEFQQEIKALATEKN
jgi:hypothetical protein